MDLLPVREAGERWGITARMATIYCETGRIPGAFKKGNLWLIPGDAVKPADRRKKSRMNTGITIKKRETDEEIVGKAYVQLLVSHK